MTRMQKDFPGYLTRFLGRYQLSNCAISNNYLVDRCGDCSMSLDLSCAERCR